MSKYYNDYELLYLIERKSLIALEILYEKYKVLLITKLRRYTFSVEFKEEVIQECLMEMSSSIKKFDHRYNTLLYTYIDTIFERKIVKLIIKYYKNKEVVEYFIDDASRHLNDCVVEYEKNISSIHVKQNLEVVNCKLNDFEKVVLQNVMLNSCSIKYIKDKYNVNEKKIYNTVQSIRKKFSTHYIKEKNSGL